MRIMLWSKAKLGRCLVTISGILSTQVSLIKARSTRSWTSGKSDCLLDSIYLGPKNLVLVKQLLIVKS